MSNVIKQRQLSNGEKLTPKSDLVYNLKVDHSGDISTSTVYDIDGTIKINEIANTTLTDIYQYTSVGKGQFITMRPSPSQGAILKLWDKNTGADLNTQNLGLLNGTDGWIAEDIQTKSMFTFLGTPFKSRGDNDRYIIVVQAATTDNKKYYPSLFNIDKWEWKNQRVTAGYDIYFDLKYDGVDTVYVCYNGERIQVANIFNWYDGISTSLTELKDVVGDNLTAQRLYGMTSTETGATPRLVYADSNNYLRTFNLDTLSKSGVYQSLDSFGTIVMLPAGEKTTFTQSQSFIESSADGVNIKKRDGGQLINLVNAGTSFRTLKVIDFKHIENVSTEIIVAGVNKDSFDRQIRKFVVDWTGGYTADAPVTIVSSFSKTFITAGEPIVNDNEISNSTNSYGIGKFYNYGLQKQWDNR